MDDTDASDEEARTQAASVDERARESGAATRPGARPPRAELGRGALLGRYVILERLGAGGMGVVHAAYDPELDRKVAIKLLHSGRGGRAASERARARLLREAQALARLSHPNVVAVHDVGTFDGQVFVAMELIEGETLGAWLASAPRSQRAILDVFVAAGRGLAAAHAAGLIHRDFKPENLMIGRDGRVRVMDFGLARATGELSDSGVPAELSTSGSLSVKLTATAGFMGTPAYMAPEQHLGQPVDARTDLFAFCVALYEALYGERPFEGESIARLAIAVCGGQLRPPPRGSRVPARLRRALLRGLSVDPGERYPSMDPLIDELARDPRAARRRVALIGVGALLTGGLMWISAEGDVDPCAGADARWSEVWSEDARAAVAGAFRASGRSHAELTLGRVSARLDAYGEGWRGAYTGICEATRVRSELSEATMDLEMACLQRRLDGVAALVGVLASADAEVVDRALEGASTLAPLEPCRDVAALTAAFPPPADPAAREAVAALRRRLAAIDAEIAGGRFRAAADAVAAIDAEVRTAAYPPLDAEYARRAARVAERLAQDDAEERAWAAIDAAARAGDRELYAIGTISLARLVGTNDPARRLVRAAESAADLAGDRYPIALARAKLRVDALGEAGELSAAIDASDAVRSLILAQPEPDALELAHLAESRGELLRRLGRDDEARAAYAETARIFDEVYGPDHPYVANILIDLANLEINAGEFASARARLERAIVLRREAYGPESERVARVLYNLANVHRLAGDAAAAAATLDEARAIFEARLPAGHPTLAYVWGLRSRLDFEAARFAESRAALERAVAINDAAFGPEHPEIVADLVGLAALQLRDRDVDAAAPALARARRILDAQGEATVERFLLLRTEAELAHHRGRRGEAIAGLRAALAFASGRDDVEAIDRADAELALATLLAGERGGRGDALALAEAAATTFGDATTPYGRARAAEAAALLARLRP